MASVSTRDTLKISVTLAVVLVGAYVAVEAGRAWIARQPNGLRPLSLYQVELQNGSRRCVLATGYAWQQELAYVFVEEDVPVATFRSVENIVRVTSCTERAR